MKFTRTEPAIVNASDPDSSQFDVDQEGSERFASWVLRGPLAVLVGLLCLWELATWAPNYLTWPLWADHDVFATSAKCWDSGVLPYREINGNNFPGTTYIFWILGKLCGFGWGLGPGFYGFDAALVGLFGAGLIAWSGRRFGRLLPGLIGYGGFLGYYLALDYSQAAQRDWQGPLLAIFGLLLVQAWPGRTSRVLAGLTSALGLIIRPQAVLLLPAQALAVASEARQSGRSGILATIEWGIALALGLALGFLPVVMAGIWPDFLHALKVVSYGGKYNLVTPAMFAEQMLIQLQPLRLDIVPIAILLLAKQAQPETRRTAWPWLVAMLGVLFYRPMSPHPHAYLSHPTMIVWTGLVAILVQIVLDQVRLPASVRLVAILLIAGLGLTAKPRFCNPNGSLEAFSFLKTHREPGPKPTGYARHPDVPAAAFYEWEDYRNLLDYLRTTTSPTTKVANCLKHVPAITGPTGRLPAFPAESVAWLTVVREDEEETFADQLRKATDTVVVWAPTEKEMARAPKLPVLTRAIEDNYAFEARFGLIEVWRRKPIDAAEGTK
ncbi:MAG: hypothetical protein JWN86_2373 [Planctomycetota bacterium]|nr:hypothetical protein [Planctomycetota bacterium]